MGVSHRHTHLEMASLPKKTLDGYRSAMKRDQFLHQRKSDARALVCSPAGIFDPVKPLKDFRQLVLGDADAGVAYAQFDKAWLRSRFSKLSECDFDFSCQGILESV